MIIEGTKYEQLSSEDKILSDEISKQNISISHNGVLVKYDKDKKKYNPILEYEVV